MDQVLPQFIRFGREICGDLAQAERREWWLANGLGGYAAGTIAGTLTRRYHGLLVAPLVPPLGRVLVLAKADATLHVNDTAYPLHVNRWADGAVVPAGHLHLESFRLDGRLPVWRYAVAGVRLEARVWMEPGAHATYVGYRLLSEPRAADQLRLTIRLLANARDHHGESRVGDFTMAAEVGEGEMQVVLPRGATLRLRSRCGQFAPDHTWIERFQLLAERERGLPDEDNHLSIGEVRLPLLGDEWVGFVASLEDDPSPYLGEALQRRRQHDARLLRTAKVQSPTLVDAPSWVDQLVLAADSFVIARRTEDTSQGLSVIAGYPWFSDWGRDTFVALPGLTLCTGHHEQAHRILATWARFRDGGLLPNYFPDGSGGPQYNSADAPLWYVEAWRAYLEASNDLAAVAQEFPALADMLARYGQEGRAAIALDPADGLIRAGTAQTQLTWMDARVAGRPVTPRMGKPVELNALWYNALMSLAGFAHTLQRDAGPLEHMAARARAGFQRFVREAGEGLLDVLDGPIGNDTTVRPNQILAVSLRHSPLDATAQASAVRVVTEKLLTTYGLRTLDPAHPDYRGVYAGGVDARDAAYHQGAAWGWLLGHCALAHYRTTGDASAALSLIEPLRDHLADGGLGTVSELFDGDPPHQPRGAPAQAWSVGCTLQAWCQLEAARRAASPGIRE